MTRFIILAGCAFAVLASAATAAANIKNSIQPAHVYFGTVQAGDHPNKLVTLHNGTGKAQVINRSVAISGAGGYVFTTPTATAAIRSSGLPECMLGTRLAPGARCVIDVRVHTVRAGWWRAVLRVVYADGTFNSAELRAHVVSGVLHNGAPA